MADQTFEFLRDSKVYINYNSTNYQLHVAPGISFGQTFNQDETDKKTLHTQLDVFKGSSITSANPANFSFTIPLANDGATSHQRRPLDLLLDYSGTSLNTFTLYIDPTHSPYTQGGDDYDSKMYKIEGCVITNGTFSIPREGVLSVDISGEGTKLSRIDGPFTGTLAAGYDQFMTYSIPRLVDVAVAGNSLANVLNVGLEIQNEIEWNKNDTLQQSLAVTSASNTIYPASFILAGRTLSGSITQYVNQGDAGIADYTRSYNNLLTWQEYTEIRIRAGLSLGAPELEVHLTALSSSFTNRFNTAEAFTQSYDYRLMTSPADLNSYFTY